MNPPVIKIKSRPEREQEHFEKRVAGERLLWGLRTALDEFSNDPSALAIHKEAASGWRDKIDDYFTEGGER